MCDDASPAEHAGVGLVGDLPLAVVENGVAQLLAEASAAGVVDGEADCRPVGVEEDDAGHRHPRCADGLRKVRPGLRERTR